MTKMIYRSDGIAEASGMSPLPCGIQLCGGFRYEAGGEVLLSL